MTMADTNDRRSHRPGPIAIALALLAALFLLAPLIAVVPISLTPNRFLSMPTDAISLRHYATLFTDPAWRDAALVSLRIATLASVISVALAATFSIGLWLARPKRAALIVGFVLMPMVVPPVVSAMVLYFLLTFLSRIQPFVGYDTEAGVVLAHVVLNVPFAVVLMLVALSGVDRRIDLAARSMGATFTMRAFRIVLPNVRHAFAGALLTTFVLSRDETAVTLFVTSVDAVTLPRLMWMGLRDNIDPAVAAASVVLTLLTVTALVAQRLFLRRTTRP